MFLDFISLRPVHPDDAEAITRLLADDVELALRTSSFPIPYTLENARSFLSKADPRTTFAVLRGDEVIGVAGSLPGTEPVEIGYWIGRPYWQKGYATAAVGLLLEEMKALGIERFSALVFPDNAASMRVLEKNGFVRIGEVEKDLPLRGGRRRLVRFEICRSMHSNSSFPAPVYAETVLSVNFADAQRRFLDPLLEIQYVHTLMLAKQGIMPADAARACLEALNGLDRAALAGCRYDPRFEDLFFYVESELAARCGAENAGRMHIARSRNDIAVTMYRMVLRRLVLTLVEAVQGAKLALLEIARAHVGTLIPAYTHTQPAQPTTLAHYFLAAIECFERDENRLMAAFETVNRSPLGACAITTTGFPIDREYTAELLGFEGLQLNAYGAIAATDYLTEAAGAVATAAVNLGRLGQDLLLWCNPELGYLRLSGAWVQSSSIMPQKRNPVALEHTRILSSRALAQAQAVFSSVHNTPFGDIVDSEDDLQPLVFEVMSLALRAFQLFAGVMADAEFDVARLEERASANFLTVTELADTITREEGIGFRSAHGLVSEAVTRLAGRYSAEAMADAVLELARGVLGRALGVPREVLLRALGARSFVAGRAIPGGPAVSAVEAAISLSEERNSAVETWIREKTALMAGYGERMRDAVAGLMLK